MMAQDKKLQPGSGLAKAQLRQKAEDTLRDNAVYLPEEREGISPDEIQQMLHELQVHQIELEMQNEELRTAQTRIEAGRARYFDLYDLAPVGYCTLSEKGLIMEANHRTAVLLGVARDVLSQQPFTRFIFKEDQDIHYLHRKYIFETGELQAYELRMAKMDGTAFWAHLTTTLAHESDGVPVCRIVLRDITDRKRAETALKASLAEKEVLLQEVHHRVKNNLAAIIGLLDLQTDGIADEAALASLRTLSDRIRSMALVHERLYRSEDMARIDFQGFLRDLTSQLLKSFGAESYITCIVESTGVEVGLDTAMPFGLIVNELVTNAIKYAFPGGKPRPGAKGCEILITVQSRREDFTLTVADNGVGLPADFDCRATSSLGLRLVRMLGENQLKGQIQLSQAEGTHFTLRLNDRRIEQHGRWKYSFCQE